MRETSDPASTRNSPLKNFSTRVYTVKYPSVDSFKLSLFCQLKGLLSVCLQVEILAASPTLLNFPIFVVFTPNLWVAGFKYKAIFANEHTTLWNACRQEVWPMWDRCLMSVKSIVLSQQNSNYKNALDPKKNKNIQIQMYYNVKFIYMYKKILSN